MTARPVGLGATDGVAPWLTVAAAADPLLPAEGGRDVAALVPGAQLEIYPGMGHDLPTGLTPKLVDRIAMFCKAT